ncbi:hypothetical protein ACFVWN_24395 [Nocardiopsis flavescens]|uniref:hypothetical protein n=1 Tax=Nocardiopsis flavescens TaxID=758803 RepID=UPI00364783B7
MPGHLTPARFVDLYDLGARPHLLPYRASVGDRRRREWLIDAGLLAVCDPLDRGYAFRITEAGLAALREHLDFLEERESQGLAHRSGNEYGIQRGVLASRAGLDAALARRARGEAAPVEAAGIEWWAGQGTPAWEGSPPEVLGAVAVLRAAGHAPMDWTAVGGPRGFYVEQRGPLLYVYHGEGLRSQREDGGWFTAQVRAYADALRAAGWRVDTDAGRCAHVRAPGSG